MITLVTFRKTVVVTLGLFLLLLVVMAFSLSFGAARLPAGEVIGVMLRVLEAFSRDRPEPAEAVILFIRLPRILLASLVGASLAVAGAAFQALTRNPLADPFILGVSSGAAFGVVIAQTLGLGRVLPGYLGLPLSAFLGAIVAALAVYLIARVDGAFPIQTLLLAGVSISLFFSASITLFISLMSGQELPGILHWLMGSLGPIDYSSLTLLLGCLLLAMGAIYRQARSLNLLVLGEEVAMQLGMEGERVKRLVFVMASLLTGVAVAFSGSIGFVGLIVPHIARILFGPDNRLLIPAAALVGASFLVTADAMARIIVSPAEVPVGVITAFCGAPFFIYLLRKQQRSP